MRQQLEKSGPTGWNFTEIGAYFETTVDEETRKVLELMQKKFKASTGQVAKKFLRATVDDDLAGGGWRVLSTTYMPIERVDQDHLETTVLSSEGSSKLGEAVLSSLKA